MIKDSFNEAYRELAEMILYSPEYTITSKDGADLSEIVDFKFTVTDPTKCFATCRQLSMSYLRGELKFYLSGSPFVEDITVHSKFWNKISDDGRTVNSNYGKLLLHDRNLHNYTQFEYAEEMLTRNIESKKAVMVIYNKDHAYKSKDNPCTMFLQFVVREGILHLYVKMRSSDIWFGLPYDVPFFCLIQLMMVNRLEQKGMDVSVGTYNHQSTSLHLYERNRSEIVNSFRETDNGKELSQEHLFSTTIKPFLTWRK